MEELIDVIVFLALCQLFFIRKYLRQLVILKQKELNLSDADAQQLFDGAAGRWLALPNTKKKPVQTPAGPKD